MVPLSIVERELRVASRKRGTYVLRLVAPVVTACITIAFVLSSNYAWKTSGEGLFRALIGFTFWVAMASGLFVTADCLSSEKRQGTLGLLFLTKLRAREVILGKLVATSTTAVLMLIPVGPMLALPLLLGGVAFQDVLIAAAFLGLVMLLSLSLGILVSALSNTEFEGMFGTALLLIACCVLPLLLASFWDWSFGRPIYPTGRVPLAAFLRLLSPYHLGDILFDPGKAPPGQLVGLAFVWLGGLCVLSLALAARLVRNTFQEGQGGITFSIKKIWAFIRTYFSPRSRTPNQHAA